VGSDFIGNGRSAGAELVTALVCDAITQVAEGDLVAVHEEGGDGDLVGRRRLFPAVAHAEITSYRERELRDFDHLGWGPVAIAIAIAVTIAIAVSVPIPIAVTHGRARHRPVTFAIGPRVSAAAERQSKDEKNRENGRSHARIKPQGSGPVNQLETLQEGSGRRVAATVASMQTEVREHDAGRAVGPGRLEVDANLCPPARTSVEKRPTV